MLKFLRWAFPIIFYLDYLLLLRNSFILFHLFYEKIFKILQRFYMIRTETDLPHLPDESSVIYQIILFLTDLCCFKKLHVKLACVRGYYFLFLFSSVLL